MIANLIKNVRLSVAVRKWSLDKCSLDTFSSELLSHKIALVQLGDLVGTFETDFEANQLTKNSHREGSFGGRTLKKIQRPLSRRAFRVRSRSGISRLKLERSVRIKAPNSDAY